ncbi:diguanylate cyclase [Imhoffiella purpurea]|uniref:GGDEF domain-containing protein n=1 Tax=Imhoffiella purpurea TaxID=1249627 RepID=W9VYH9_9GAMM|nr:diguanylate cyclase [Imhoffiella purpurea]EXJ15445.1 hypothetical protein D779_1409 [Imhoffiella purpurea]
MPQSSAPSSRGWSLAPACPRLDRCLLTQIILWLLLGLTSDRILADPSTLIVSPDEERYELASHVEYLEDPTGELTFAQVSAPGLGAEFRPLPRGDEINFGYSSSTYWLRFSVATASESATEWWLEAAYFSLGQIHLYGPEGPPVLTGNAYPFEQRPVGHRFFVIPIRVGSRATTFYLEIRSVGSLTIPLRLWRPAAFTSETAASYTAMALYFGALAALLLYNLLLYLSLREGSYLIYVCFVASMACGQLALTGIGNQYVWTGWETWNGAASDFGFSAAGVFGLWFARRFLDTRGVMPRLDRMLQIVLAVFAFNLIYIGVHDLLLASTPTPLSSKILSINSLPGCMLVIAAGMIGLRHGRSGARFLLIAWAVLLVGAALASMRNFGWVPTNTLTSYTLQIGSALEMLLLSFALADRIHSERHAREVAQTESLIARQAMVDTLDQAQRTLETRIAERTQELAKANRRLRDSERLLRQAAHSDPLTGLANRLLLDDRIEHALAAAQRDRQSVGLLLVDLDRFKPVNDLHGHSAGDEVLKEVARRIQGTVRVCDTVARIGGDEFVVLLERLHDAVGAIQVADKLVTTLSAPFHIGELELAIGASIGISLYPEDALTAKMLRQHADWSMYAAKRAGGNSYQSYWTIQQTRPSQGNDAPFLDETRMSEASI